jgi:lipopolysaccharide transport system permease protein
MSENVAIRRSDSANDTEAGSNRFHIAAPLPDEPLIKIRPSGAWELIDLVEVWAHRDLFLFLVWRDLKVRYKQTALGASWVILQPLLMTLIFVVFLGLVVRLPTEHVPYPLFLYASLVSWTFFSNAVASGSHSLLANAPMITKVYFPRVIVPAAAVAVRLFDFLIASLILLVLVAYYGIHPTWKLLMLPVLVGHLTLLAAAIGLWLSALNVRYRDIGTGIPLLLQLWMFVSPIIYPASQVPPRWRAIYNLNPLTGIIENLRASLFGFPFSYGSLASSAFLTIAFLVYSAHIFRRMEDEFADVI